jgi:lipoic acid synthetase
VDRDDLDDGGAAHFAATVHAIKQVTPSARVEVLVPDFKGSRASVATVVQSPVDVYNHNVETVPSLYRKCRPGGHYPVSLEVLAYAKRVALESRRTILTKTGIMLGLGEERVELVSVFKDLRAVDCDILTLGQYLRPSEAHLPVVRYLPPVEFAELKAEALALGFRHVESGPLVRSSYHAWEHVN